MFHATKAKLAIALTTAVTAAAMAGPASAAPRQEGLVNVNISDVTVQVPVGVAANLCDVNAAVLATVVDQPAECDATAESIATRGPGNGGSPRQEGLVNVNISDVTAQVPISVAANLCDINVAVLAELVELGEAECTATAETIASRGRS